MWNCIIRWRGRFWSTAGLSFEKRLHSIIRCRAVCSTSSGQLQNGVGAFSFYGGTSENSRGLLGVGWGCVLTNGSSIWAFAGTALTRENRGAWRKTCLSAILSTKNTNWTNLHWDRARAFAVRYSDWPSEPWHSLNLWKPEEALIGQFNTLRTGSFKLFKRPFPEFLTILTL